MTLPLPLVATFFWLLSFICSFTWIASFETEFVIASLSCLFIATSLSDGAGISRREWPVPVSSVLIAGGLMWLVALVSVATSDILFISWIYFFFFSALPLTVIFFLVGDDAAARFRLAWNGIRVVLAALSIYALAQYLFMPGILKGGRVYEPFADPNSFAAILSLGMFFISGPLLGRKNSFSWLDIGLLGLMAAAFLTTGSRGATLSLALMSVMFVVSIGPRHISRKLWVALAGLLVGAVLLAGLLAPLKGVGIFSILTQSPIAAFDRVIEIRTLIWGSALQIVHDHPWLGTGIGTFQFYYPEVRTDADNTFGFMVHNDPIQFAVEMGILSPILFFIVIVLACFRTAKTLRVIPRGDERRAEIMGPIFGLGALVIHSNFTYNFHVLPCLMLAGFVFAYWYHRTEKVLNDVPHIIRAPRYLNKTALEGIFLIVAFIMITIVAAPLYSQVLVRNAENDLHNGRLEDFAHKINLADTLSLGTNYQAYLQAAAVPIGILEQTVKPLSQEEKDKFATEALHLLDGAESSNPRATDVLVQRAKLMEIQGDIGSSENLLQEALRLDRFNLTARMELGALLDKNGRYDEALQIMNEGLDFRYGPARASQYMEYFIQTMAMQEAQAKRQGAGSRKVP